MQEIRNIILFSFERSLKVLETWEKKIIKFDCFYHLDQSSKKRQKLSFVSLLILFKISLNIITHTRNFFLPKKKTLYSFLSLIFLLSSLWTHSFLWYLYKYNARRPFCLAFPIFISMRGLGQEHYVLKQFKEWRPLVIDFIFMFGIRVIIYTLWTEKSCIWETLNLLMCADSSTNTFFLYQVSGVRCQVPQPWTLPFLTSPVAKTEKSTFSVRWFFTLSEKKLQNMRPMTFHYFSLGIFFVNNQSDILHL